MMNLVDYMWNDELVDYKWNDELVDYMWNDELEDYMWNDELGGLHVKWWTWWFTCEMMNLVDYMWKW